MKLFIKYKLNVEEIIIDTNGLYKVDIRCCFLHAGEPPLVYSYMIDNRVKLKEKFSEFKYRVTTIEIEILCQ